MSACASLRTGDSALPPRAPGRRAPPGTPSPAGRRPPRARPPRRAGAGAAGGPSPASPSAAPGARFGRTAGTSGIPNALPRRARLTLARRGSASGDAAAPGTGTPSETRTRGGGGTTAPPGPGGTRSANSGADAGAAGAGASPPSDAASEPLASDGAAVDSPKGSPTSDGAAASSFVKRSVHGRTRIYGGRCPRIGANGCINGRLRRRCVIGGVRRCARVRTVKTHGGRKRSPHTVIGARRWTSQRRVRPKRGGRRPSGAPGARHRRRGSLPALSPREHLRP